VSKKMWRSFFAQFQPASTTVSRLMSETVDAAGERRFQ